VDQINSTPNAEEEEEEEDTHNAVVTVCNYQTHTCAGWNNRGKNSQQGFGIRECILLCMLHFFSCVFLSKTIKRVFSRAAVKAM
jgi:hypothetical protein